MVQYIVQTPLESLTPAVAIGDEAHEVFGRHVDDQEEVALHTGVVPTP